jgi:hypothetical protein
MVRVWGPVLVNGVENVSTCPLLQTINLQSAPHRWHEQGGTQTIWLGSSLRRPVTNHQIAQDTDAKVEAKGRDV